MRERIQKLLAARGVGSRRQVEAWIAAGRITVNGRPATPGQPVNEADDIRLDGRRLRLRRVAGTAPSGVAYHRPAGEDIRPGESGEASSIERLPKSGGFRWIPVNPLPPQDGGLEIFVSDGALAASLARKGAGIESEFSVRVRGAFDESAIEETVVEACRAASVHGEVTQASAAGGEGTNRWLQLRVKGLRPRELRQVLQGCGLEPNRILRTRFGPIAMDRALARGRSRALNDAEMQELRAAAGMSATGRRTTRR